ncbi:hypothetical protein GFS24_19465 [Chitinophaga sp. SYP-B3965]|uniref:hypothetical protein n=1 Tax=Chitinophaga sp. SYP-B3965 TaxID=2663120 RepID=UPI001299E30B|nr:hypothetical protein [Chitinophaga sp. SYP-B3965]MRG47310.1 hypothetical protein [Chitinophaga sp. SYP-B3965]
MIYTLIGLVVLGGLIFYISYKQRAKQTENKPSDSPYLDLRKMAFNVTPEQLELSIPSGETKVFGVIMDWDLGEGTMSLISYETGDASIYFSSGGGVIGGGKHENVNKASKEFVSKAQNYLGKSLRTEILPLPDKNCVRFYFLTNKGKFVAQETMSNIENNSSEWTLFFEEANNVITELRLTTEKK